MKLLFEIKKEKLKTKMLLKLPGILDEQESSVQSAEQVWSWGNMYLPKHGKWPSQHLLYPKINASVNLAVPNNHTLALS